MQKRSFFPLFFESHAERFTFGTICISATNCFLCTSYKKQGLRILYWKIPFNFDYENLMFLEQKRVFDKF